VLDYRTIHAGRRRGYFPGVDASRLGVAMVARPKDRAIEITVNMVTVTTSLDTIKRTYIRRAALGIVPAGSAN
jgi:hypothetical protein